MDNLICTECGTTYYSAAARSMIERGESCDCGGALRLIEADDRIAVAGLAERPRAGVGAAQPNGSRFARRQGIR